MRSGWVGGVFPTRCRARRAFAFTFPAQNHCFTITIRQKTTPQTGPTAKKFFFRNFRCQIFWPNEK
jgi:hypothetical protein